MKNNNTLVFTCGIYQSISRWIMTDPIEEVLSTNIIFFRDLQGEAHTIYFDTIILFLFDRYRYYLSYTKPNNGGYSYCYLDDDDPTNYVIYRGKKYTNL